MVRDNRNCESAHRPPRPPIGRCPRLNIVVSEVAVQREEIQRMMTLRRSGQKPITRFPIAACCRVIAATIVVMSVSHCPADEPDQQLRTLVKDEDFRATRSGMGFAIACCRQSAASSARSLDMRKQISRGASTRGKSAARCNAPSSALITQNRSTRRICRTASPPADALPSRMPKEAAASCSGGSMKHPTAGARPIRSACGSTATAAST